MDVIFEAHTKVFYILTLLLFWLTSMCHRVLIQRIRCILCLPGPRLSMGKQEAFETFRRDHEDRLTIEDNKTVLKHRLVGETQDKTLASEGADRVTRRPPLVRYMYFSEHTPTRCTSVLSTLTCENVNTVLSPRECGGGCLERTQILSSSATSGRAVVVVALCSPGVYNTYVDRRDQRWTEISHNAAPVETHRWYLLYVIWDRRTTENMCDVTHSVRQ